MITALKKLLFGRESSSLNLFLVMPVLVLMSVCCLCSGGDEPQTCITSDGSTLVWAGSHLLNISLADGSVTTADQARYTDVICAENNEIIAFKEEYVRKNNESRKARTAVWRNSAKTYQLADIESFQKYHGVIQNRYFVSSSRGFVEKSRSSGKSTVRYNYYDQPQIFTLEDSSSGELKSHYLHRDKLGLPETFLYDDLWFYVLSIDENGSLLFGMHNKIERQVSLFKINMFDGNITRTGVSVPLPKDMRHLERVVSGKKGKFVAFVYRGDDGTGSQTLINVLNTETNQTVVSKSVKGISLMNDSPNLFFEEGGTKLAIMVEGLRYEPSQGVREITVFDLAAGKEISNIDAINFFKEPEKVGFIRFLGNDLLLTYSPKEKPFREKESHLCKVDLLTKQIIWDVNLP